MDKKNTLILTYLQLLKYTAIDLTTSSTYFLNIIIHILMKIVEIIKCPPFNVSIPSSMPYSLFPWYLPHGYLSEIAKISLHTFALPFVSCSFVYPYWLLFLGVSLLSHSSLILQQKKLFSLAEFHYSIQPGQNIKRPSNKIRPFLCLFFAKRMSFIPFWSLPDFHVRKRSVRKWIIVPFRLIIYREEIKWEPNILKLPSIIFHPSSINSS